MLLLYLNHHLILSPLFFLQSLKLHVLKLNKNIDELKLQLVSGPSCNNYLFIFNFFILFLKYIIFQIQLRDIIDYLPARLKIRRLTVGK